MKKQLLTTLILLIIASTGLYSSEIVPMWNTEISLEDIIDIEFMPNREEFMLTSITDEIQIRDVYTGGIKKLFRDKTSLFMKGYFEFTPDSARVVMGYDGLLQLIRLEDFERLDFYAFVNDTIKDEFRDLVLDPIKPHVYTIISGRELTSGNNEVRSKISIYNYETMELVSDLTDYIDNEYTAIAVSNDGKYLAALNEGKANLRVWDLETKKLVKLVKLYDDELEGNNWCEAKDIQFSEFNTDIIYYSGRFVYKDKSKFRNGLITYNFKEDTYSNLWLNEIQAGKFMFLDEEKTLLNYNGTNSHFYDLDSSVISKKIEMSIELPFYTRTIYSEKEKIFIGCAKRYIGAMFYDTQSGINENSLQELAISPNPTSGFLKIDLRNETLVTSYKIIDTNGKQVLTRSTTPTSSLNIDVESLLVGVYIIELTTTRGDVVTDKFVRE